MPGFYFNFSGGKASLERDSELAKLLWRESQRYQSREATRFQEGGYTEGKLRTEMVGYRERYIISVGWQKMRSAQLAICGSSS